MLDKEETQEIMTALDTNVDHLELMDSLVGNVTLEQSFSYLVEALTCTNIILQEYGKRLEVLEQSLNQGSETVPALDSYGLDKPWG